MVFLPLCGRKPRRGKTLQFLQPTDAEAFYWKANEYNLPCGIHMLFEVAVKIEMGRKQLPEDTPFYIEDTVVLCYEHTKQ